LVGFLSEDENGKPYDQVLGISNSSSMSSMVKAVQKPQSISTGRINIEVIDSQTTSVGLGHPCAGRS